MSQLLTNFQQNIWGGGAGVFLKRCLPQQTWGRCLIWHMCLGEDVQVDLRQVGEKLVYPEGLWIFTQRAWHDDSTV